MTHSAAAVPCPSCGRLTILTIAHAYTITLYDSRTGNPTPRTLGKRQCLGCGGADAISVPDAPAAASPRTAAPRTKRR